MNEIKETKGIKKTQVKRKILAVGILVALVASITVVAIVVTDTTDADVILTPPNVEMCNLDGNTYSGTMDSWCTTSSTEVPSDSKDWNCGASTLHFDGLSGGNIIKHWLRVTNYGTTAVGGYLVYKVTCDLGFTNDVDDNIPDDITGVSGCIYDWVQGTSTKVCLPYTPDDLNYAYDDVTGVFYVWLDTYLYPSGDDGNQYYVRADITFHNDASGTYTIHTSIEDNEPVPIKASTMVFQGTDDPQTTGAHVYEMIDESISGNPGDGIAGFDVLGKNGAKAWFGDVVSSTVTWTSQLMSNYDAWPSDTPDTPDWYQYSLEVKDDNIWAIRNHAGATEANPWYDTITPKGVPMSGTMDWQNMYAYEMDIGAYISGTGTAEIPNGASGYGGGQQAWDMDWSWGSEYIPLQYPGFDVTVTGSAPYTITLTPAEP